VFTVEQTSCSTESHYVRSGDSLVLVGNCLTGSTIPNGSVQAAGDGVQGDRTQSRP
jgi:hypothetical protein